jgi:hypothetical protein
MAERRLALRRPAPKRQAPKKRKQQSTPGVPVSYATNVRLPPPKYSPSRNGMLVTNHEYLAPVTGYVAFGTSIVRTMDPTDKTNFRWLSAIADRFQTYEFKRLVFHYTTAVATSTAGSIVAYYNPDPADTPNKSFQGAMAQPRAVLATPYRSFSLTANVAACKPRVKIAQGNRTGEILRNFAAGFLYVGSQDFGSEITCGHLWMEYTVELKTPVLGPQPGTESDAAMASNRTLICDVPSGQTFSDGVEERLDIEANSSDGLEPPDYQKMGITNYATGILKIAARTAVRCIMDVDWKNTAAEATTSLIQWARSASAAGLPSTARDTAVGVDHGRASSHAWTSTANAKHSQTSAHVLVNPTDNDMYFGAYCTVTGAAGTLTTSGTTRAVFMSA